jgi:GTP cyclohydrolase I
MEQSFLSLLEAIGEDPQREGLVRTLAALRAHSNF